MNRFIALLAILFVTCIVGVGQSANPYHPYHVSLAEIEFNQETGNYEVSLCVWPADLERALGRMSEEPVDLDTAENLDELITKYLEQKFQFRSADDSVAPIRFVGKELDLKQGWLYFEMQTTSDQVNVQTDQQVAAPTTWTLDNQIFFELNDDQANHCNLKVAAEIKSAACTLSSPAFKLN